MMVQYGFPLSLIFLTRIALVIFLSRVGYFHAYRKKTLKETFKG